MSLKRQLLMAFIVPLLFVPAVLAKEKNTAPQVIAVPDVPLQKTDFEDRRPPRQCDSSFLMPDQVCWTVYPVAWQSFDKQRKGINLLVNVLGGPSSGANFTSAALTIAVDGKVIELPTLDWNPGPYSFSGNTAVLTDESLLRAIAGGTEVWLTAFGSPRISVKLSAKTLDSMKAVLSKYDSLN